MMEDFLDYVFLLPLDERDNAHLLSTIRAGQRVHLEDALDEHGPGGGVFTRRFFELGIIPGLPLVPLAAHLVGVPPVIPDLEFATVRDVLGDFRQKIQGFKTSKLRFGPAVSAAQRRKFNHR